MLLKNLFYRKPCYRKSTNTYVMTIKIVYLERSLDDPRESIPDSLLPFDGKNVTFSIAKPNNRKWNAFPSHLVPCRCATSREYRTSFLPFDGKNVTISMSTLNNRKLNVFPSHLEPCRCVTTSVLRLLVNTYATPHDVARWIVESRYTVYT